MESEKKFALSVDVIDDIVRTTLADDYRSMKNDNRILNRKRLKWADFEREDFENNEEYIKSYETLLKYYFSWDDAIDIMEQERLLDNLDSVDMESYDQAHGHLDLEDRISTIEDRLYSLEKMFMRDHYNRNVDL